MVTQMLPLSQNPYETSEVASDGPRSGAAYLLKWSVVPCLVLIIAAWLTYTRRFDVSWIIVAFAISSLATLYLWRQATYRLTPSATTTGLDWQRLDERQQRQLRNGTIFTFAVSLVLMVTALTFFIGVPVAKTKSGTTMVFTVMAWASIVRIGALNVLTHYVLSSNRPNRSA